MDYEYADVSDLLGRVVKRIQQNGNESIIFFMEDGDVYKMFHEQDCCEDVRIEEIHGNLDDLCGSPILMAEEVCVGPKWTAWGRERATFYKFATIRGYVTIRWYGESNGYYSERVDFVKLEDD